MDWGCEMKIVKNRIITSFEDIKGAIMIDGENKICDLSWRYIVVAVWDSVEDSLGLNYSNIWASHSQSTWIGWIGCLE